MRLSHCVLHKECAGCAEGVRYTARFYASPIDAEADFNKLPPFIGCCTLRVLGTDVHITCMVMVEVEVEGKKYGYTFENKYRLDLWRELMLAEPEVLTAHYERHRKDGKLTPISLSITRQLLYLTRLHSITTP